MFPGSILAYTDAKYRMLYNKITIPLFFLGLMYSIWQGNIKSALLGSGIAFGIMFICALMGGISGGDVKLAAGLGIWFGYPNVIYIIIISCFIGFIWGSIKLYKQGVFKQRMSIFFKGLYLRIVYGNKGAIVLPKLPEEGVPEDSIPYGTFMVLAAWLIFVKEVLPWIS